MYILNFYFAEFRSIFYLLLKRIFKMKKKYIKKSKMLSLSQEKTMLPNYDHANDRNRKLCLFCNLHRVELKLLALKKTKEIALL